MIEVNNLTIQYGKKKVIDNLCFTINKGEVVLLNGNNGSGKTTLCYALSGIITRNIRANIKGDIYIENKNIKTLNQADLTSTIGIVIQNPDNMLISPKVEDELSFAPENLNLSREEIIVRVNNAIKLTGIEQLRYKHPIKLSGGEKQKVAIASVLTQDPKIIIFDEVMSCLDCGGREMFLSLIMHLKEKGKTLIIIEHNYNCIPYDRIISLSQ